MISYLYHNKEERRWSSRVKHAKDSEGKLLTEHKAHTPGLPNHYFGPRGMTWRLASDVCSFSWPLLYPDHRVLL